MVSITKSAICILSVFSSVSFSLGHRFLLEHHNDEDNKNTDRLPHVDAAGSGHELNNDGDVGLIEPGILSSKCPERCQNPGGCSPQIPQIPSVPGGCTPQIPGGCSPQVPQIPQIPSVPGGCNPQIPGGCSPQVPQNPPIPQIPVIQGPASGCNNGWCCLQHPCSTCDSGGCFEQPCSGCESGCCEPVGSEQNVKEMEDVKASEPLPPKQRHHTRHSSKH